MSEMDIHLSWYTSREERNVHLVLIDLSATMFIHGKVCNEVAELMVYLKNECCMQMKYAW